MAPKARAGAHLSVPGAVGMRSESVSGRSDRSGERSDESDKQDARNRSRSLSGTPGPSRKRASRPKVRTGCISCKKRHVKCDEKKPTCNNCNALNIPCEGYAGPKATKSPARVEKRQLLPRPQLLAAAATPAAQASLLPRSLSPRMQFDLPEDSWYFTLFSEKIVYELSPCYQSNFWSRTSLRDSMTHQCIQHSILSIGAYARALVDLKNDYPWLASADRPWWPRGVTNRHREAAIWHHDKAISALRQGIGAQATDDRTTMHATLLLIVFENMQGNYHNAGNLIRSGIKVLNNLGHSVAKKRYELRARCEAFEPPDEIDEMAHMFARHSIAGANTPFPHGKNAYHLLLDDDTEYSLEEKTNFTIPRTLEHARLIWDHFLPVLANFYNKALWHNINPGYDFDLDEATKEQLRFLDKLGDFGAGLEILNSAELEGRRQRGILFLRLHQKVATIFVSCCLDSTEMSYDAFVAQFEEILADCRAFAARSDVIMEMGFRNEVGTLPLIAFVATKCRVRRIRLEALEMLEDIKWREGPWDGTSLSHAIVGLMRLEGQNRANEADGLISDGSGPSHLGNGFLPPPEKRYVWTNMFWDFEKSQIIMDYAKAVPAPPNEASTATYTITI